MSCKWTGTRVGTKSEDLGHVVVTVTAPLALCAVRPGPRVVSAPAVSVGSREPSLVLPSRGPEQRDVTGPAQPPERAGPGLGPGAEPGPRAASALLPAPSRTPAGAEDLPRGGDGSARAWRGCTPGKAPESLVRKVTCVLLAAWPGPPRHVAPRHGGLSDRRPQHDTALGHWNRSSHHATNT